MTAFEDGSGRKRAGSLRELPRSIEPPRDLWPRIEARLGQREARALTTVQPTAARPGSMRLRWLAAAAMVASVAIGVWIGRSVLPGGSVGVVQASRGGASAPAAVLGAPGALDAPSTLDATYEADPRYERQRAQLLHSLQEQLAALPPASRAKVMASLETVQQAKEDLEQALGKDPGNALLQELLINTYQDEMRVLTDVREASDSGKGI